MVQVAAVTFSSSPNVNEARIEIHREGRGQRELWLARPVSAGDLPFPPQSVLQQTEIPLRFLSPKDENDPMEFGDSRGLEKAVVDLLQILEADSGSLCLIETEWFIYLCSTTLCEELSQRVFPIGSSWAPLGDRLLEDEDATFDVVDVDTNILREVLSLPDVVRREDGMVQIPLKSAIQLSLPKDVMRTGIIVNNCHWIMLVGNPIDREFVPFGLDWRFNNETFGEVMFVPHVADALPLNGSDTDVRVKRGRAPSGSILFFTQSDSDPIGSVRIEPELLSRPYYEQVLEQ